MKYLIFSDVHGSAAACEKILEHFKRLNVDYMILSGDILYHGPRNPLPEGHNPKKVAELLNSYADQLICCRGNCDAEVDQMVLNFPVLADFAFVVDEGIKIFCSHGHIYSPLRADGNIAVESSKIPAIAKAGIAFYGHTHVQVLEKNADGIIVCNPGSVSLPKGETPAGFAVYENACVTLYDIEGNPLKQLHC